jgi:hypothetical protein
VLAKTECFVPNLVPKCVVHIGETIGYTIKILNWIHELNLDQVNFKLDLKKI